MYFRICQNFQTVRLLEITKKDRDFKLNNI